MSFARPAILSGLALTGAVSISSLPVLAQQPIALEGIVISASRFAEAESKVGSAVTVISRDEIEAAKADNVAELLETVAGVSVNQAGGIGGTANVTIRGAEPDHTLVLIDGVRINDPGQASGEFDFSLFTLANVERIEVLRGPQSGLYGSDAIGGVVNIITRKGEGPAQGLAEVEGGSFTTHAERAAVSGSENGIAMSAAASNFRSSGFSRSALDDEADATAKQSANIRIDADITPAAGITLNLGRYRVKSETDTIISRGVNDTAEKILSTAALTGRFDLWDGLVSNKVTVFGNWTEREFFEDDVSSSAGLQPQTDFFDGSRIGIEAQSDITVREVDRLTLGARSERETAEQVTQALSGTTVALDGEERTNAVFALYEFNPLDRLTLTAAIRSEDFGSPGVEQTYRFTGAFRIPETDTKLRGSFGTGAKAPTLFQRFGTSSFAIGNPDLEIEKSTGFDFGVDQTFSDGDVTLSATYFHNDIENLIEFFDPDGFFGPLPGTYENIASAETRGVELSAMWRAASWISLRGAYTYIDAIDATTGDKLARRPDHAFNAKITVEPLDKLKLSASATYVGERFNRSEEREPLDDYIRVDLAGTYDVREDVELFFRADNVFDADYQEIKDFNTAGRSGYVGLRARF
ncbi:MAG: TonB-dependent receptor plug domain-containing protein [Rhodomicrobiaceae bacterium]